MVARGDSRALLLVSRLSRQEVQELQTSNSFILRKIYAFFFFLNHSPIFHAFSPCFDKFEKYLRRRDVNNAQVSFDIEYILKVFVYFRSEVS